MYLDKAYVLPAFCRTSIDERIFDVCKKRTALCYIIKCLKTLQYINEAAGNLLNVVFQLKGTQMADVFVSLPF